MMPAIGQRFHNPTGRQSIKFVQLPVDPFHDDLVMESRYEPHSLIPPLHYHPDQEEVFEVHQGILTVSMDGLEILKQAGESFTVPARTAHAMWNTGEEEVVIKWTVRPALDTPQFMQIVYTLAEQGMMKPDGSLPFLQSMSLMRRYGHVFRPAGIPFGIVRVLAWLMAPVAALVRVQ